MSQFLGKIECKVDSKGRFLLPTKFFLELSEDGKEANAISLIMRKATALDCYEIYTEKRFDELAQLFANKMIQLKKKASVAKFVFYKSVEKVSLDKQKRFSIPATKRTEFGADLILVGMNDHFQLWDVAKFEKAEELTAEYEEIFDEMFPVQFSIGQN